MNPKINFIAESVKKFIRRNARANLNNLIAKVHSSEFAAAMAIFKPVIREALLNILIEEDIQKTADILVETDEHIILPILEKLDDKIIAKLLKELNSDDAVSLIEGLPEEKKESILEFFHGSEEVEEQLMYEEETAGRIMTRNFFSLHEDLTVKEAIETLQQLEEKAEMVFYLYLTDSSEHLAGVLSLRQLLLSSPDTVMSDIMNREIYSVRVEMDREDVADIVSQYDLLAVPVVDLENKLVGIITVDDVIDIIREEAEEDIYKMAGTSEEELLYRGNPFKVVKIRMPWLFPAFVGALLVSKILGYIEGSLSQFAMLIVFMPIINATAGNIGIQSTTIMARELAFDRIEKNQWKEILFNQLKIGLLLGLIFGIIAFCFAYFTAPETNVPVYVVGLSVGLALLAAIIISTVYGTMLPILLQKMGFDPAVSTGPFIAASNDLIGLASYFSISWILLYKLNIVTFASLF